MHALKGSPYEVDEARESQFTAHIQRVQDRVALLRSQGRLSSATVARYYESTRLIDVTESNAIEGSTLTLHETELAVMKGTTITGHDPGYVRDARSLFAAFQGLVELARQPSPTDIQQVKMVHELIMGQQPGAGLFRNQPVRISGAEHRPPRDWQGVMKGMEGWQAWSQAAAGVSPLLRAAALHAWLAHIHPFTDGNGRTARALTTLEMVRAGYPPLILRRKDRPRYYEALAEADNADLGPFLELVLGRAEDALRDLEFTAAAVHRDDPALAALHRRQEAKVTIWNKAVALLMATVEAEIGALQDSGAVSGRVESYAPIDVEDYLQLSARLPISSSWAFAIRLEAPASEPVARLAWIGYRSDEMMRELGPTEPQGPTLFWSVPSAPGVYPKWRRAKLDEVPGPEEATYTSDGWRARVGAQAEIVTTELLAKRIVEGLVRRLEQGS